MDGTLLDSSSNISPESAKVIRAAASAGVQVILATGKARPAAIAAARKAQLEGDSLLVSHSRPGVFLQVTTAAYTVVIDALTGGCQDFAVAESPEPPVRQQSGLQLSVRG